MSKGSKGSPDNKHIKKLKQAIVKGRDRGVVDRNGNTIPKEKRGAGKGDRFRTYGPLYEKNAEQLFGTKLNVWPRDKDGNLIEDD